MPLSSSGSGHLSFKEAAGIRLPLGVGYCESKLIVDYQLSINPYPYHPISISYIIYVYMIWILPGSMPERLMGTDCKFVDNMSTLVQIQLGPKIRRFLMI